MVAGVKVQGRWTYPMGITAPPGTSSTWSIIGFPIAVNDTRHLQLDEVGVVPQSFHPLERREVRQSAGGARAACHGAGAIRSPIAGSRNLARGREAGWDDD